MLVADIKEIIENNKGDIAFIIGNGINRYSTNSNVLSWHNLLIQLPSRPFPMWRCAATVSAR